MLDVVYIGLVCEGLCIVDLLVVFVVWIIVYFDVLLFVD